MISKGEKIAAGISTRVICKEPGRYIGWPTIAKTREGELLVVFSGDREAHVCPWGKTEMVRSRDGGKTWTEPVAINNTPLDDRDAGIIETTQGTLLVSWFTSLVFERNPRWHRHAEQITPEVREQWHGNWVRRSVDGGNTWQEPTRTIGSAPHGPIQLSDGRLLYIGRCVHFRKGGQGSGAIKSAHRLIGPDGQFALTVEESRDDGRSWELIATVPVPPDESGVYYQEEPHVAELDGGKLVAMFRYQPSLSFLRQSESSDGGKTWSVTHKTPIRGYPPHLIRLRNNWLLAVYGRRIPPFGVRACISRDEGETWDIDNEIVLSEAWNEDLGYPSSVQLDDDSILTVYYQIDKPGEKTCLMSTYWRLA